MDAFAHFAAKISEDSLVFVDLQGFQVDKTVKLTDPQTNCKRSKPDGQNSGVGQAGMTGVNSF